MNIVFLGLAVAAVFLLLKNWLDQLSYRQEEIKRAEDESNRVFKLLGEEIVKPPEEKRKRGTTRRAPI